MEQVEIDSESRLEDFHFISNILLIIELLLTRKLLNQGFPLVKLKSSRRKFYSRYHDLVKYYGVSMSKMTMDMFHLS